MGPYVLTAILSGVSLIAVHVIGQNELNAFCQFLDICLKL